MNIYDSKPIVTPEWELTLIIEMGTFQNDNWMPNNAIVPFGLEVYYDDVKLELGNVIGEHRFNFPDTDKETQHTLRLVVTNTHWEHLMRCRVLVEDVDIGYVIEEYGSYATDNDIVGSGTDILGCNGTMTLPIHTPIYKWLMVNKQNVLSKLNTIK